VKGKWTRAISAIYMASQRDQWSRSRTNLQRQGDERSRPMGVEKDNVTTFEVRVSINNPGGE